MHTTGVPLQWRPTIDSAGIARSRPDRGQRETVARLWIAVAALNGFIAVAAGAFAAHGLAAAATPDELDAFQTAARYHMYHSLAIFGTALLAERAPRGGRAAGIAAKLFLVGIILFCGSLYMLGATGSRALVLVTPVGGLAFLGGWLALAFAGLRLPASRSG